MKKFAFAFVCMLLSCHAWSAELKDPDWVTGKLENGIRYYLRPNAKPAGRLEMRLVVEVGSIVEDEDQRGLAHYLEHLAFNGTEKFEKDALVKFLESLGVGFGPDLNAYTSFDETVYQLRVPTEDPEIVDTGLQILAEWAGKISNTDQAIADERGVIIEEWRGRRGASARVRDEQYPLLFPGSQYPERLPIGTMQVLENFEFDRLRDFYKDWYRPDLMSVVIVGEMDVEQTEKRIQELFKDLAMPENPRERKRYFHPEVEGTRAGVFTDPELTDSQLAIFWMHPWDPPKDEASYKRHVKEQLLLRMFNQRLAEISQKADAPFLGAGGYRGSYTNGGEVFVVYAGLEDREGAAADAGVALLSEIERARQHGFTEGELKRSVVSMIRSQEQRVLEKANTNSQAWIGQMVNHITDGTLLLAPEQELALMREALMDAKTSELQEMLKSWMKPNNRVILVEGPEKDGTSNLPGEENLLAMLEHAKDLEVEPYVDALSDAALVKELPEPGRVVVKDRIDELGVEYWTLSNGIRIMVKATDFKQDEIVMRAWSPGGTHLMDLTELPNGSQAANVILSGGLADFSAVDLQKLMAGKLAGVSPFIAGDEEGLRGGSSVKDLETLLQLTHLYFTSPRKDPDAFAALKKRMMDAMRNRESDPRTRFSDLITRSMNEFHPRFDPPSLEDVEALELDKAFELYQQRFANPADFGFLFVGSFDPVELEPLVSRWLGSLPTDESREEAVYIDPGFPEGEMMRGMRAGLDPISQVRMIWTQPDFEWNYKSRYEIRSMARALNTRLREVIREEKGGTYSIGAWADLQARPDPVAKMTVAFGCDPDKIEELVAEVRRVVQEVMDKPLDEHYIKTVQQTQRRRREVDIKENRFWADVLPFYEKYGEDPRVILRLEEYVNSLTPELIQATAKKYFDVDNQALFILRPEGKMETLEASPEKAGE